MPRILFEQGYKFYIYLNESPYEPSHVHVLTSSMEGEMKVWLKKIEIAECYNIPHHEWSQILKIIKKHQKFFQDKYYEFNNSQPNSQK